MKKVIALVLSLVMLVSIPFAAQAATVGKVSGVCFTAIGTEKVKLKWNRVKKATGYQIYCSTRKKNGYIKVKTVKKGKTVKATVKGLKPNKKYYFKVRAVKGKTKGSFSKAAKVRTKAEDPLKSLSKSYRAVVDEYKSTEGEFAAAYFNTLDLLTASGKQKALVITVYYSAYMQYSTVYLTNSQGVAEKYIELPGELYCVTSDRKSFVTYNYQGSGIGSYSFFSYGNGAYNKTQTYDFEMNTRDSVGETVSKKTKNYLVFEATKNVIK